MKAYSKIPKPISIREDRIYISVMDANGKVYKQGKRVTNDCPISYKARRIYIAKGTVKAVRIIMDENNLGLEDAYKLLKVARGLICRRVVI